MTGFDVSVPVVIVGGGACGAVAALAASDAGIEPLIVERDAVPAGSTAMSQGLVCAAGSKSQTAHGIVDDGSTFLADILAKTRGLADPVTARTIAFGSGPALDWLVAAHDVPLTLDTAFRAAYGNSRQRVHGWPGHGGRDLIDLLHARLAARDVPVLTAARLIDIVGDGAGIVVERPDGRHERIGCDTLILASGGFAANHEMVARHLPDVAAARHHGHEGNEGDGIVLAARLGGATGDMGSYQGYAMLAEPHGISVPPGVLFEGGVLVNAVGGRFVDETADIAGMMHAVLAQPGATAWVVYGPDVATRCAHIPEMAALTDLGAPRLATEVDALATATGVPAAALTTTLAAAETARREHRPDAFGRIWADDAPPPAAPFRAIRVTGALYHTQGGLQIDAAARVCRADGTPLANIFAGGGAARSVSGPGSWGYLPAMGLTTAVVLGRIAGDAAARQVAGRPSGG